MELLEFIKSAVGTGEIITLAYSGGSHPGDSREVIPVSYTETDLYAMEPDNKIRKQFKIAKILSITTSDGQKIENIVSARLIKDIIPILPTIAEYVKLFAHEFEEAGWFIHNEEDSFGVGRFYKNGKPLKTPSIAIRYFDRSKEFAYDLDTNEIIEMTKELTGREQPWRVDSWRFQQGKTFKELHKAMAVFVEEVRSSNVNEAKGMFAGH
jgi:hypothetical protein